MEIRITSKQILRVLCVLSWIIFAGVCFEAGGFIFNSFFSLFINPDAAGRYWMNADLSSLYAYDRGYFIVISILMIIVAVFRVIIFYLIIKMFYDKQLSFAQPFHHKLTKYTSSIAWLALGAGLFSLWGNNYSQWLIKKGISLPEINNLRLGGADVWLFMGVILLVIAQVFKKGTEIQTENELTV